MNKNTETILAIGAIIGGGYLLYRISNKLESAVEGGAQIPIALGGAITTTSKNIGETAETTTTQLRRSVSNISDVVNTPLEIAATGQKAIKEAVGTVTTAGTTALKNVVSSVGSTWDAITQRVKNAYSGSGSTTATQLKASSNVKTATQYAKDVYTGSSPISAAKKLYGGK